MAFYYDEKDFLTDWQKNITVSLGEVVFTEKDLNNKILSIILMSTNQFDQIINFYFENFEELSSKDLIYKYFERNFHGENEYWAVDEEVEIVEIVSFLNQLYKINKNLNNLNPVIKEYEFLIKFCEKSIKNNTKIFFKADSY